MPVNKSQAKSMVRKTTIHDDGTPIIDETFTRSMQTIYQTHGSTFKNTNYITQDPYRASPALTLDMDSTYGRFCPPEKKAQNARLAVLDNFREISRIMTQNFLTHKKLEKRYEKTAIPKTEMDRKKLEDEAQQRMTVILKKMHSPA